MVKVSKTPTFSSSSGAVLTPALVYDYQRTAENVSLLQGLSKELDVNVLCALKASYAGLSLIAECGAEGSGAAITPEVGSVGEILLAQRFFAAKSHGFFVAITEADWPEIAASVSHLSFNSMAQGERFGARAVNAGIATGLRVNPLVQVSSHVDYDAGARGCRFGVPLGELPAVLPSWVRGFHVHALCENSADALFDVVVALLRDGAPWLPQLEWLNLGGGHLFTSGEYDFDKLAEVIRMIRSAYPQLNISLEPGAAWVWNTAVMQVTVLDIVVNSGISSAIVDLSFRSHLNDFLIGSMIHSLPLDIEGGAYLSAADYQELASAERARTYRIGGISCATCDTKEYYQFAQPLRVGDTLIFKNMGHYADVTFSWFNGLPPPAIYCRRGETVELIRRPTYDDFFRQELPQGR